MNSPLVSSEWLNSNLDSPDLIILDASQSNNKSGLVTEFENLQIAGARPFDIKEVFSDKDSSFPNTFPSSKQFEEGCRKLGVNSTSKIVVYDSLGVYRSPRVWWMFKAMGHDNVTVLDGGLPDWMSKEYEAEVTETKEYNPGNFQSMLRPEMVRDFEFVKENLSSNEFLVIDARSSDRFNSLVPEPRKDLRRGNIPNSINIPFQDVLEDGKFKSVEELTELFTDKDIANKSLVFSCGSGITACIVLVASDLVFKGDKSVYDGSWTEWAQLEA